MRDCRIGFTGTQKGMTTRQKTALRKYLTLADEGIEGFHHGDCIGADAEAHAIAVDVLGADRVWIHPPSNPRKRAYCHSPHILPEQDYLDRNHEIVDVTDGMLAAPAEQRERLRSGTWATIRYAKRLKRPMKILQP